MKRKLCIFIVLVMLAGLLSFPPFARAEESSVRVLLSTEGRDTLTLGLSGTYALNDVEITGGTLTVTVSGTKVAVTHSALGELFTGEKVTLTTKDRANLFTLATEGGKERAYRGSVTFDISDGAVRAVNTVGMEDYMLGVAICEVDKNSPDELLKAQLLAAKCFALAEVEVSHSKAYDVRDKTDQVYHGYDATAKKAIALAAEVADQTLLMDGKTVKTYYGASNGGATVLPGGKFNAAYAGEFDPFDITRSDAANLMVALTGDAPETMPQKLYDYLLSKADADAIVKITDVAGYPQDTTPQDGFKITMKVSRGGSESSKTVDVTFNDLTKENVILTDNSIRFAVKVKNGNWLLCWGQNKGHRKGMSQKGARRMAEMGYSFVDILKFYYPGAVLTKGDGTAIPSKADLSTEAIIRTMGGGQNQSITKTLWVSAGVAEIRSKASDSADVCARLPFKSRFGVYKQSGDWYYGIDLATGVQGWIAKKTLSQDEPAGEPAPISSPAPTPSPTFTPKTAPTDEANTSAWSGVIRQDKVTLRKDPSTNSKSVASGLRIGTLVTVYGEEGDFYYLCIDESGKTGYLNKQYVAIIGQVEPSPDEPATDPAGELIVTRYGVLNRDKVILRKGPSAEYGSAASGLRKGTALTIFAEEKGFYFLRLDESGKYGYINTKYVDLVEAPPTTPAPTYTPTPAPTATEAPTATPKPTETPTPTATATPTPSETPSSTPTGTPTSGPTGTPATGPTGTPAAEPTGTPTPTGTPASEPTPTGPLTEPTQTMIDNALIGVLNKNSVILRKGPSTGYSAVASGIAIGTEVTVYAENSDYYFLRVDQLGKYGYIPQKDVVIIGRANPSPDDPLIVNTVSGTLNRNSVILRKGPGTEHGSVASGLSKGTAVTIYMEDGSFYFLRVDSIGKYGYINKSYVDLGGAALPTPTPTATPKPTPTGPYTEPTWDMIENAVDGVLIANNVNMRKGPGTEYGLADSGLKSGMDVTVYLKQGDWYFLRVNKTGKYGYIYAEFVELDDDDEPTPTKKPTQEPAIRLDKGDVNGDGLLSAADAALILRYVADIIDLEDFRLKAADWDGDGQVTELDAKSILREVARRALR